MADAVFNRSVTMYMSILKVFVGTAIVIGIGPIVLADTISFDLGNPNAGISAYAAPFANVTVNRTSGTSATVTFTSYTNSGNIYLMGGEDALGLNVNGSFTSTTPSWANAGTGFSAPATMTQGSGNVDGHGSFNLVWKFSDGLTNTADVSSFTLTKSSGTWATASAVLTPNLSGYRGAAHIFVTSSPANIANGALDTGFAAEGGVVPLPAAAWMGMSLLGGVGGVGFFRRRRLVEA
jgi:hypothetical protein